MRLEVAEDEWAIVLDITLQSQQDQMKSKRYGYWRSESVSAKEKKVKSAIAGKSRAR